MEQNTQNKKNLTNG